MTHMILDIRPEFFLSAPILCSLKPSLPNSIFSFKFFTKFKFCEFFSTKVLNEIKNFVRRLAPQNQYYFVVFFIFRNSYITWQTTALYQKNPFFLSYLTTNIFMLVNIEPIFNSYWKSTVGVSEFCHQIKFDGTELFARPDTLSYQPLCLCQWKANIGDTIHIGQEIRCLPYAEFFFS